MAISIDQLLSELVDGQFISTADARQIKQRVNDRTTVDEILGQLVAAGQLSDYQADQVREGNTRRLALGDYTLIRPLGAGGMGQVFLARHQHLKRQVAVKILPAGHTDSAATVERFQREMEALARLEHPNIVIAHDAGEVDGQPYLVMQYVEGEDLGSVLRRFGRLPAEAAVSAILQAARGVQYAHEEGVIHRDLKPSNLLRDRRGTVRVLDMGLARITTASHPTDTADELTASGQILGTVDYMPPEQAEDTHQADERSDIYSLGCTLYSLLCGQPIYEGDSVVKKIIAHREQPVPSVRNKRKDVSAALDEIYQKMVAKRPEDRYANMELVIQALESCQAVDKAGGAPPLNETIDLSAAARSVSGQPAVPEKATLTAAPQANPPSATSRGITHETVAFNKQQDTTPNYRVPAAPRRRRHRRRWPGVLFLLLLISATVIGLAWWDERFDYFQLRQRLGQITSTTPPTEKTLPTVSGIVHRHHFQAHGTAIRGLAVSPDGTTVASVADVLKSWNSQRLSEDYELDADGVHQLMYSPNGQWLVGTGRLGVRMWDPFSGEVRSRLSGQTGDASRVAFSPDSQLLAVAGRRLSLWSTDTGKIFQLFPEPLDSATAMSFAPDGKLLTTGHEDGTIILWSVGSAALNRQRNGNGTAVRSLSFSPRGTYLAVGDDRGTISLWAVATWRAEGRYLGHTGAVTGLVFVDGERRLISSGSDGTVRVWDKSSQAEIGQLLSDGEPVTALVLGGKGRVVATSSTDGTIHIWGITTTDRP